MAEARRRDTAAPLASHQRVAREWAGQDAALSSTLVETPSASAALIETDRSEVVTGDWYAEDVHFMRASRRRRPSPPPSAAPPAPRRVRIGMSPILDVVKAMVRRLQTSPACRLPPEGRQ